MTPRRVEETMTEREVILNYYLRKKDDARFLRAQREALAEAVSLGMIRAFGSSK
jgi:hypothetical protein